MKIISWNVNGIRSAASKGLFDWLSVSSPDILLLQETKASPDMLGAQFLEPRDGSGTPYKAYWASAKRRGYSGVAVFTRIVPQSVSFLGVDGFDDEGRTLVLDYGSLVVVSTYFPNSQDAGARLPYKLAYCQSIRSLCDDVVSRGKHIVVGGDYNIAHKSVDLSNPKANEGNPGYLPEERAWMDEFIQAGYVDSFRVFDKGPERYSWWSYRTHARERNVGWRLDYHCVDPAFKDALRGAAILADVPGSDHCPVSVDIDVNLGK